MSEMKISPSRDNKENQHTTPVADASSKRRRQQQEQQNQNTSNSNNNARQRRGVHYYESSNYDTPVKVVSPGIERQIADAILDRISEEITQERLIKNRSETGMIEYKERTVREEIITSCFLYYDQLQGKLDYLAEKHQKAMPINTRAGPRNCISKLEAKAIDIRKQDIEEEKRSREQGRKDLESDREKTKEDVKRREEMRRKLREDMVGFRAAGVFLIAEEARQRGLEENEYGSRLMDLRRRFAENEETTMKLVLQREKKEEVARQEVLAAAKREASALDEKRQAEVHRRQQKLIGKCTHARNGQSVFAGAYPKKMCLICRIKLDPISGLYVTMEKHK